MTSHTPFLGGRRLRLTAVLTGLLCVLYPVCCFTPCPHAEPLPSTLEQKIKAACIYNFLKFVTWPENHPESDGETVSICIFGRNTFGDVFAPIQGASVQGKRLAIRQITSLQEAHGCLILFISASQSADLPSIIQALEGTSTLTVSDIPGFARRGGIIGFYKTEDTIRFEINLEAASRADLRISSKLLELATIVQGH